MVKNKIKAIIFDVGGVLQLTNYDDIGKGGHHVLGVHEYLAKKLKRDLDSWFDAIDTPYGRSMDGSIARNKAISIMSKNLNISEKRFTRLFYKAYKKFFKKNRKLYRTAHRLRKKGYKIGILSDQWYLSKDVLTPKKDMKNFNIVIISCDVGIRKPNSKIFKLLIKKCKCKAEEILFIDNRDWNLKPARKLGIKTILFKSNKQVIKDLKKGLL
jgi:epoxide hydrolase-like predicted phosphatase